MSAYNKNTDRTDRGNLSEPADQTSTGERARTPPKSVPVCLVGLGCVGLPLAVEFDHAGQRVGYDIDEQRIRRLESGTNEDFHVAYSPKRTSPGDDRGLIYRRL